MIFDFSTLITDRTMADVDAALGVINRVTNGTATSEEQQRIYDGLLKGMYDFTDLNRVNSCMEYLSTKLNDMGYANDYKKSKIHRRRVPRLPIGYTELEYIESTGTQYINTGIKPTGRTTVVTEGSFAKQTASAWLFGCRSDSQTKAYSFLTYNDQYRSDYGNGAGSPIGIIGLDENNFVVEKRKNETYVSNLLVASADYLDFQCEYDLVLFANNNAGEITGFCSVKRKYFKIYDSDSLLMDLVPCKDPYGTIGMFDLVSKTFFGSQGTGSFLPGPDRDPVLVPSTEDPYVWLRTDEPLPVDLEAYRQNVEAIRKAIKAPYEALYVPALTEKFTFEGANRIEQVLIEVNEALENISSSVNIGWALGISDVGLYGGL